MLFSIELLYHFLCTSSPGRCFFIFPICLFLSVKVFFFYFLTEIMWMYKVRVETVRADCWLCYIVLTLCVPIAWLRKWMNDNINILKQSGSMLLIHSQLTMGFDQLCHHKEREILTGRDRNCVDQRWIFVSDSSVCIGRWRTWLY